ncbi:MAG: BamA/TamA family outer membrane protein [Balneolaceae bacterium]
MRILITTLIFGLSLSFSASAQNPEINFYESVDLYNGLDKNFYTGSSFGVKNPVYAAYPVSGMIRHNRVDGLFLGYQEEKMDWGNSNYLGIENVDIHGLIGYSMEQREIQYSIGAEKSIGNNRKWLLFGGDFHNTTATEDYWRSGVYENSISSFVTGYDFYDYYKADGYGFYSLIKPFRFLELGASYNVDDISTMHASTDFSLVSRYSTFRINPAIDSEVDQISQQSVTLGLTLNPYGLKKNSLVWTTFSAKAEIADLDKSSNNFLYNRYQVEAKSFLRLDKSSLIKWRVMAGSITGEAPDFKNFALGGIGSMRALGYKSLIGNQMLLSNLEIELGKISNKNNGWPELNSLLISIFLDSGISQFNPDYYNTSNIISEFDIAFSELSHNAGIGLGLGMLRFEIAKPIAGENGQTAFWIRFNPTF